MPLNINTAHSPGISVSPVVYVGATASTTLTPWQTRVKVANAAQAAAIVLPDASESAGMFVTIEKLASQNADVTCAIAGVTWTIASTNAGFIVAFSDGTRWYNIASLNAS